jgi:NADH dehydrogenase
MERKRIVIVGGGFAGVWAAVGASRMLRRNGAEAKVGITLVSPDDALVIRPRLYESDLSGARVPLDRVLSPLGIDNRRARVEGIDAERRRLMLLGRFPGELAYDQLVLCPGSSLRLPENADGLHCVDSYEQAAALHRAVVELGDRPGAPFSAAIVGAGFAGLELAAELPGMLRAAARSAGDSAADISVCLIDQAGTVAPEFGPRARVVIEEALSSLGVRTQTGVPVSGADAGGVTLASGKRIESSLTIWAAGPRASALNEQLGLPLEAKGRVVADAHMATGIDGIWAAGDSAAVSVDGEHLAMMSCQQAMPQGRQAGENAAAAILGRSLGHYRQPLYLTCLDLGSAGGLLTCGFERDKVIASGEQAKRFKRSLIYPPASGIAGEILDLGKPATAGPLAAKAQRLALRSTALRNAMISRSDDRAERYSLPSSFDHREQRLVEHG